MNRSVSLRCSTAPSPDKKRCGRATSTLHTIPPRSTMDEDRDLAMGEDLNRLAAEDDRGDTMLDLDRLACDACYLGCCGGDAESFLGVLMHARFELSRCIEFRAVCWYQ